MGSTVKTTKPIIDERPERHTAGIRVTTPMRGFSKVIRKTLIEILAWAREHELGTGEPPFMRLHVINMAELMDMEIGIRVAEPIQSDGRVMPGILPAGRYASLIYTGRNRGYAGNSVLINWAQKQGLKWDSWETPAGDAFACRYEAFLTDPADEPDHKLWETEVAIKLTDE